MTADYPFDYCCLCGGKPLVTDLTCQRCEDKSASERVLAEQRDEAARAEARRRGWIP